ncbi:unnamed protein product [Fusarium graminearum]|nr:unnamed protein product [Fusarium graminearum]
MTMKVTQEEVPKNQLCHKRTRPLPISTVKSARDKDIWHVIKAGKETTKRENNTINARQRMRSKSAPDPARPMSMPMQKQVQPVSSWQNSIELRMSGELD